MSAAKPPEAVGPSLFDAVSDALTALEALQGTRANAAAFEGKLHQRSYAILPVPDAKRVSVARETDGTITLSLSGLTKLQCREALEAFARMIDLAEAKCA